MAKKVRKEEVILDEKKAPEKKSDITPGNMKVFIETYGTDEEKEANKKWFKEQCQSFQTDANPKYGVDETKLRNAFIEKFYRGQYEKATIKKKFWDDINKW